MDPLLKLLKIEINFSRCIVCQSKDTANLRATTEGVASLKSATTIRRLRCDTSNEVAITRIEGAFRENKESDIKYHKNCFSSYTSKEKLDCLSKLQCLNTHEESNNGTASSRSTRSSAGTTHDDLCVLCQTDVHPEHIRIVRTPNMHLKFEELAQHDFNLRRRLTKGFDNIASDILYHTYCLANKERESKSFRKGRSSYSSETSNALKQICQELRNAAAKGQVLHLPLIFSRYKDIAESIGEEVPLSFLSRPSTFMEKIRSMIGDLFECYRPMDRDVNERQTLLIPKKFKHTLTAAAAHADLQTEAEKEPQFDSGDVQLQELVHVAYRLRSSLLSGRGQTGIDVTLQSAKKIVPADVYLFLSIIFGSENDLEGGESSSKSDFNFEALSVGQDLFYIANHGRKLTPKHIGLGLTLHQKTRKKELVKLFHKSGHCASYEQVLRADTSLAHISLRSLDRETGAVVPLNLKPVPSANSSEDVNVQEEVSHHPMLHFTADNLDLLTDTLDGKKTFHVTQMVVFQHDAGDFDNLLKDSEVLSKEKKLSLPEVLIGIKTGNSFKENPPPVFDVSIERDWYEAPAEPAGCVVNSRTKDLAFLLLRQEEGHMGWTEFNKTTASDSPDGLTSVGYMPIIMYPAHEMDTLFVVLSRCVSVSTRLGFEFCTLTVDQNLYCKLIELRWIFPEFKKHVVLRMGGLHIALNYLRGIGQHMTDAGLAEMWVDCNVLAEGTAQKVIAGRHYSKGMRMHKLTLQALWRRLYPEFDLYLDNTDSDLQRVVDWDVSLKDIPNLMKTLSESKFEMHFKEFIEQECERNVNFQFWWNYMEAVLILLQFTRSIREANWELYLETLTEMLPLLAHYDHQNYVKSMTVYIAEMHQLPPSVESAFRAGDFVAKRSNGKFNSVDFDHAQEWLIGEGKGAGGIVGITGEDSALQRWALTHMWRTEISRRTMDMFGLTSRIDLHSELLPGRAARDQADEDAIYQCINASGILCPGSDCDTLQNYLTRDLAPEKVKLSLLSMKTKGLSIIQDFVATRLLPDSSISYYEKLKKNQPLTFSDIAKAKSSKEAQQKKLKKAERCVMQDLIGAYDSGRSVNLREVLKHELVKFPPALAYDTETLRGGNKSQLLHEMLKSSGVKSQASLVVEKYSSHLIIDGQAMVMAVGKPENLRTFGDLADRFVNDIRDLGKTFSRIDLVFDVYRELSVKQGTREKRSKGIQPVRRIIDSRDVPLPSSWSKFTALSANKSNLAEFLASEILLKDYGDLEVVIAGSFSDPTEVRSSNVQFRSETLASSQEEADTRMVLHVSKSPFKTVVVSARDTDVFVLLVAHFEATQCQECWMKAGTKKQPKYIPIHDVVNGLTPDVLANLSAFHSVLGCDVTSYPRGITKIRAWKAYLEKPHLLSSLGCNDADEDIMLEKAEEFLARLYSANDLTTNDARYSLFCKCSQDMLPPTSDSLRQHILRSHYQATVWRTSRCQFPDLPEPIKCGWKLEGNKLVPVLSTQPSVPESSPHLQACHCKSGCGTNRCRCRKSIPSLLCTSMCGCKANCCNGKKNK